MLRTCLMAVEAASLALCCASTEAQERYPLGSAGFLTADSTPWQHAHCVSCSETMPSFGGPRTYEESELPQEENFSGQVMKLFGTVYQDEETSVESRIGLGGYKLGLTVHLGNQAPAGGVAPRAQLAPKQVQAGMSWQ